MLEETQRALFFFVYDDKVGNKPLNCADLKRLQRIFLHAIQFCLDLTCFQQIQAASYFAIDRNMIKLNKGIVTNNGNNLMLI